MSTLRDLLQKSKSASASRQGPNKSRYMYIARQGDRWRFSAPPCLATFGVDTHMRYFRSEDLATRHLEEVFRPVGISLHDLRRPQTDGPVSADVSDIEDDVEDDTANDNALLCLAETAIEDWENQLESILQRHQNEHVKTRKSTEYLFVEKDLDNNFSIHVPVDLHQFLKTPIFRFSRARDAHLHIKAALQHQTYDDELLFA